MPTTAPLRVQDDYSLGEPDWSEVTTDTALNLHALLPTKKELLQLIERFGGTEEDTEQADELWHSAQKEEAAKQRADREGDLTRTSLRNTLDMDAMAKHRASDGSSGNGSGHGGDAGKQMAQEAKERDKGVGLTGAAAKKKKREKGREAQRNEVYKSVHSADALLKMFQVCTSQQLVPNAQRGHGGCAARLCVHVGQLVI